MITRFIALFLMFTLCFSAFAKKKKNVEFIYLDQEEVLNIVMIDNIHDMGSSRDRFFYFEKALEEVLAEIDFPMEVNIEEFGARIPKDNPTLRVYVQKWDRDNYGELEVRLSANLRSASGIKNKLGFYRERDGGTVFLGGSFREKSYRDVMKKTLLEIFKEVNEHFPLPDTMMESAVPMEEPITE